MQCTLPIVLCLLLYYLSLANAFFFFGLLTTPGDDQRLLLVLCSVITPLTYRLAVCKVCTLPTGPTKASLHFHGIFALFFCWEITVSGLVS